MSFDISKPYQRRDGKAVNWIHPALGGYVYGFGGNNYQWVDERGLLYENGSANTAADLINTPPPITSKWVNVYPDGKCYEHDRRELAESNALCSDVIARLRLDFEGESLKDVEIVWRK